MFKKLVFILSLLFSLQSFANGPAILPANSIQSFHEWKNDKVKLAMSQMQLVRAQLSKAQAEGKKNNVEAFEKQLDQIKWNLEVAQDLSVTDYFVVYLSPQTNPEKFQMAAAKMSTKEVAQLMEAYADTLSPSPTEAVVEAPRQALIPAKLPVQAIQNRSQVK